MTMSDWMRTKVGFQMAETITRQLPRIAKSLEDISKGNTTGDKYAFSQPLRKIVKRLEQFFDNDIEGLGAVEHKELKELCFDLDDIADEIDYNL